MTDENSGNDDVIETQPVVNRDPMATQMVFVTTNGLGQGRIIEVQKGSHWQKKCLLLFGSSFDCSYQHFRKRKRNYKLKLLESEFI